jgi:TPR repeat protein
VVNLLSELCNCRGSWWSEQRSGGGHVVPARGQATQAGNASAQYNLGSLHATGYDLPVDLGVAATWYAKAAAAGHAKAQLDLGTIQIHGLTGARDFMRGLALLRQAARQKTHGRRGRSPHRRSVRSGVLAR